MTSATAAGIGNKNDAVTSAAAKKKILEVERLAEMERQKRQKEAEQKSIEEEANKRIEELVAKRVEEELERRRDEIEAEVLRRVEEAKKIMEAQMLQELERRKEEQLEEARRREVRNLQVILKSYTRRRGYYHVGRRGLLQGDATPPLLFNMSLKPTQRF